MRKLYCLLLAVIFISFSAQAQFIEKGRHLLGGSLGINFSTVDDSTDNGGNRLKTRNFSFSLSPSYGKAIKPNLVFGYYLSLGVSSARNEDERTANVGKSTGYQAGGGVFVEKFFPLSSKLAFSGRLSGGLGYSSFTGKNYFNAVLAQTNKSNNFTAGVSVAPALSYKVSQKFLIDVYANDFIGLSFIRGTTETSVPNANTVKTYHTNFNASTMLNYGKALSNISFSFRYIF